MKIIFFGTSNVALPVLEVLDKHHEVLAVVTQPDAPAGRKRQFTESPVSVLAKEMGKKTFKPEKVKNNELLRMELENLKAEIFVVVAYGQILPRDIINLPAFKTVNVHFSPLPKYRGPSPIQSALLNGDQQTGTTIFILDELVDHGPMIAQEIINIEPDDNFITLSEKLARRSANLIVPVLEGYVSGKTTPLPQDDAAATRTKIITKNDGRVQWQKTAGEIYNQFRAFYPWPGIWTIWNGKKLKILDCRPVKKTAGLAGNPGSVLEGGLVACGNGQALQINSLQLEGKAETDIGSFLNGYQNFPGSLLE
ncbi:MAG: methionyl-tRNA formyltransferase [Patescibacteria group bacterium]|nr:methionyl-tRNA formyltransferase [Patescibacteria group bacterium]